MQLLVVCCHAIQTICLFEYIVILKAWVNQYYKKKSIFLSNNYHIHHLSIDVHRTQNFMWKTFRERTKVTFLNKSCRHQPTDYNILQEPTCWRHQFLFYKNNVGTNLHSTTICRNQPTGYTNPLFHKHK